MLTKNDRVKLSGEVFTPTDLVNKLLDGLPKNVWFDQTMRWLEPSCGDGNFLVVILNRLSITLAGWQADPILLHQHIIENMLFGIDLMQDNVDACINRLNANHLKHHIVCADALTYHFRFDEWENQQEDLFIWPS